MPRDLQVAFSLPSRLLHPSPLPPRRTPAGLHLPDSVQPARPRPMSRDTWAGSEPPPHQPCAAPEAERGKWARPRRTTLIGLLGCQSPLSFFPPHRPLGAAAGRGLPVWAERRTEGGAVWRRKQARPGGGSPGRTMDSQGRKVVVCDNGTGVRPGGTAACVCGVRAGPSATRLGCGGAGRRAGGLAGAREDVRGAPAGREPVAGS